MIVLGSLMLVAVIIGLIGGIQAIFWKDTPISERSDEQLHAQRKKCYDLGTKADTQVMANRYFERLMAIEAEILKRMEAQGFVLQPKDQVRSKEWYERLKPIIDEAVEKTAEKEFLPKSCALDMLSEQFANRRDEYIRIGISRLEAENLACKEIFMVDINGDRISPQLS